MQVPEIARRQSRAASLSLTESSLFRPSGKVSRSMHDSEDWPGSKQTDSSRSADGAHGGGNLTRIQFECAPPPKKIGTTIAPRFFLG
jgi:hypothetical protein